MYKALYASFGGSPHFNYFRKQFLENFHFWWSAGQKNSQICRRFAYLIQKVDFIAIINFFDLDITPYELFSIDNYKRKKLLAPTKKTQKSIQFDQVQFCLNNTLHF